MAIVRNLFPYPGGKTYLADWIVSNFPQHKCYVEVFGGAGSVLVQKPESRVEVINDRDGDIVQFYEVLRDRSTELADWLDRTPYARDVHEEWAEEFYSGVRPDDPIERAGRFFYLRYSQFASKYASASGFRSGRTRNIANELRQQSDAFDELSERLRKVQIENGDYSDIFDRFDGPETLFYCDPPYVDEGDALYRHGEFDHKRFAGSVDSLEGHAAISYMDIPEELSDWHTEERDSGQHMNKGHRSDDRRGSATERLVMNYDPHKSLQFSEAGQTTLTLD